MQNCAIFTSHNVTIAPFLYLFCTLMCTVTISLIILHALCTVTISFFIHFVHMCPGLPSQRYLVKSSLFSAVVLNLYTRSYPLTFHKIFSYPLSAIKSNW